MDDDKKTSPHDLRPRSRNPVLWILIGVLVLNIGLSVREAHAQVSSPNSGIALLTAILAQLLVIDDDIKALQPVRGPAP